MAGGGGPPSIGSLVFLFIFFSLLIGIFLKSLLLRLKFAYTPIIFIYGILTGVFSEKLGIMGKATAIIQDINPHLLLLIFLPALIFESAFNMSWHTFRKEILKAILLAIPGCLLNTLLVAITLKYVLLYDFSFVSAFLFGAIINLTDPQAVIPTLHDVGVSKILLTLIEGEALIKDGMCVILFQILSSLAQEDSHLTSKQTAKMIASLVLGGPILGVSFGIAAAYWLGKMLNKPVIELTIIFITPFLLFYTCEDTGIEFSGVVGILALGLFMSNYGKTRFSNETIHIAHGFWEFLTYCAETLVFIVSGVLIGEKIRDIHQDISVNDWLALFPLFGILIFLRTFVIMLFYPILKRIGYGMTWKNAAVLVYSGLRGAVALVLALTVYSNHNIKDDTRTKVLFFTASLTSLTILINGTTMKYFVKWLKAVEENPAQKKIYDQIVLHLIDSTEVIINENLKSNSYLNFVDWNYVKSLVTSSEFDEIYENSHRNVQHHAEISDREGLRKQLTLSGDPHVSLVQEARHRFLTILKGVYWEEFERGQCRPDVIIKLIEATDTAIDRENEELKDWEILEGLITSKFRWKMRALARAIIPNYFFKKWIVSSIGSNYESAVSFIQDHETSLERLKDFRFPEHIYNIIKKEAFGNIELAIEYLNEHITKDYPEVVVAIQNNKAAYHVLHYQLNFTKHFFEKGCLTSHEFHHATKIIEKLMENAQQKCLDSVEVQKSLDIGSILPNLPFFRENFTDGQLRTILEKVQKIDTEVYVRNQLIIKEGDEYKSIYIILKGSVKKFNNEYSKVYNFGSILGLPYMLNKLKSKATVTAKLVSIIFKIPFETLMPYFDNSSDLRERYWKKMIPHYLTFSPNDFGFLKENNVEKLNEFLENSTFIELRAGESISMENGAILLKGILGSANYFKRESGVDRKKRTESKECFFPVKYIKNAYDWFAVENCSIIIFNICFEDELDQERGESLNNDLNNLIDIYYLQRRRETVSTKSPRKRGTTMKVDSFNPKQFIKKPTSNPRALRIVEEFEDAKDDEKDE